MLVQVALSVVFISCCYYCKRELRRHWKKILLSVLCGFLLGSIYVYIVDPYLFYKRKIVLHYKKGTFYEYRNFQVAAKYDDNVKVLCWMFVTSHSNTEQQRFTWGRRCNKWVSFTEEEDHSLSSIVMPTKKLHVLDAMKLAMVHLNKHHINQTDWFLNVSEKMYVVMENLRYVLKGYDPDDDVHFTFTYKEKGATPYFGYVPGYVLSRGAVKKFLSVMNDNFNVYVKEIDEKDMDITEAPRIKNLLDGYTMRSIYGSTLICMTDTFHRGYDYTLTCTNNSITFHNVDSSQMPVLEYLIYDISPYGISYKHGYQ